MTLPTIGVIISVITPLGVLVYVALLTKPSLSDYSDKLNDYSTEKYRWLCNVGIEASLSGLATLLGSLAELRGLDIWSLGGLFTYVLFGILPTASRYHKHVARDIGKEEGAWKRTNYFKNFPFFCGILAFSLQEFAVLYLATLS